MLKQTLPTDLIKYTKYFFASRGDEFVTNSHHEEIAEALHKVETGEIKNLLINIPPRYGKTELAVINWISKCIAANPKCKFIHLSYSDDLALDNSSKTKEIIQSDEYQALWPVQLKQDSKSKKKWYTEEGGGLYATAAGGPVTGFGAGSTSDEGFSGAIVIDDPIKIDDADRDVERNRINERLNTTIKSRRNNRNTPIVIIMQRVHEEDMSGFVLDGGMNEEFYHLKIPAIKNGEALWPFKHTLDDLNIEKVADPVTFSGQMMQEPSPADGSYFKREYFKRFKDNPTYLHKYMTSDHAPAGGEDSDYSCFRVWGVDPLGDVYLIDGFRSQETMDVSCDKALHLIEKHRPFAWFPEDDNNWKSVAGFVTKMMRERNVFTQVHPISPHGKDKIVKAQAFQAMAASGRVYIREGAEGEDIIDQYLKFPNGKNDDEVDAGSLFGRALDMEHSAIMPPPEQQPSNDIWDKFDNDEESDSWKTA